MVVHNGHFGQLRWEQEEAGLRNALEIPCFLPPSLSTQPVLCPLKSPADCIVMLQV